MNTGIFLHIQELSKHTRFVGSDGAEKARNYITSFLEQCNISYNYSYSEIPNWSLIEMPQIEILSPESITVKSLPAIFSLPSDGWIEGELVSSGTIKMLDSFYCDKYSIVICGYEVAYIISSNVRTAMQPLPFGELDLPCVIADSSVNAKIKALLEKDETVIVRLLNSTKMDGKLKATSVFGSSLHTKKLPLICAHYDTVYNNYGAHDNASGVAILLKLIEIFNNEFHFAFFDGEECNKVGSTAFVKELKKNGLLNNISYVLEIDAVGVGEEIALLSSKKAYKPLKHIEIENVKLDSNKVSHSQQTRIAFSDVWAFMCEGIPVIRILTRGETSNRITHFPEDTIDKIEITTIENTYKVAEHIVRNLQI